MAVGLSALFVRKGLVTEEEMEKVLLEANKNKSSVVNVLIQMNFASAKQIADLCYAEYRIPLVDLGDFDLTSIPEEYLNMKLLEKHRCLPLYKQGNSIFIGTSDPTNILALEEFQFSLGLHAKAVLVEETQLNKALDQILEEEIHQLDIGEIDAEELAGIELEDTERVDDVEVFEGEEEAPIVIYVNKLMSDAIKKGASDIHFEPYEKRCRIRFRIDGILHEVAEPPVSLSARISTRIKVMAKLDIAEKRQPQDGRIKLKVARNKSVDFRVSTLPCVWGEKVVIRVLDAEKLGLGIESLGYETEQEELYVRMLKQSQGMILVTGPTGSGKTVSLYTGLGLLNVEETNISAAEDPVEMNVEGINQVNINVRAGLTFATSLRAFLRQDPDIVMVGEIRDLETAEIAVKAAQTGHLVLSTLHTNSAAETLTRLINMGVPGYNIASSVKLIIAQRLARKLCEDCKTVESIEEDVLREMGFPESVFVEGFKIYAPVGCELCSAGYRGRVGVYEMLEMNEQIANIILEGGSAIEILNVARDQGMMTLREAAYLKVSRGVTSLVEINRTIAY